MVKHTLVRLHSNDEDKEGLFDCSFSEPIMIKPYSHIALKSCSFFRNPAFFEIKPNENNFFFQLKEGATNRFECFITPKVIEKEDRVELLQEIEDLSNQKLRAEPTLETGVQIRVLYNNHLITYAMSSYGGYVGIPNIDGTTTEPVTSDPYFKQPVLNPPVPRMIVERVVPDPSYGGLFYFRASDVATVGSAGASEKIGGNFIANSLPFCRGAGVASLLISKFTNADTNIKAGAFLGLLPTGKSSKLNNENNDPTANPPLETQDFEFLIRTNPNNTNTAPYKFYRIENGVFTDLTDTNINPFKTNEQISGATSDLDFDACDTMSIQVSRGKVQGVIGSTATGTYEETVIGEYSIQYESETGIPPNEHYVVGGLFGRIATSQICAFSFTPDPYESPLRKDYFNTSSNKNLEQHKVNLFGNRRIRLKALELPAPQVQNLIWGDKDLARNLGYDKTDQNPQLIKRFTYNNPARAVIFQSNRMQHHFLGINSFLFQMLNMKINSYDSVNPNFRDNFNALMGGRQNILDCIIVNNEQGEDEQVAHEPTELLFLALDNADPLAIRNIRARLVNDDYSAPDVTGFVEACIVFRED